MTFCEIWNSLHEVHGRSAIVGSNAKDDEGYYSSGMNDVNNIESMVGSLLGLRVLDYGCGDGRVSFHLKDRCKSLVCADASSIILDKCRQRVPKAVCELVEWPKEMKEDRFDIVYAGAVVFHLTDVETFSLILQIYRKLVDGGKFVFNFCNLFHSYYNALLYSKAIAVDWKHPWPWVPQNGKSICHFAETVAKYRYVNILKDETINPFIVLVK